MSFASRRSYVAMLALPRGITKLAPISSRCKRARVIVDGHGDLRALESGGRRRDPEAPGQVDPARARGGSSAGVRPGARRARSAAGAGAHHGGRGRRAGACDRGGSRGRTPGRRLAAAAEVNELAPALAAAAKVEHQAAGRGPRYIGVLLARTCKSPVFYDQSESSAIAVAVAITRSVLRPGAFFKPTAAHRLRKCFHATRSSSPCSLT